MRWGGIKYFHIIPLKTTSVVVNSINRCMKHLEDVNESYFQHLRFAWSVAFVLLVHGLLPFVWIDKASRMIEERGK